MSGLLALLDDVAAIAKVAAASLDDIAAQAVKAGSKAAGAVIDDAAVTPKYLHGFDASRELPIIWRIAKGSFKNKLLFLLPIGLLLSTFAPWMIPPLLMLGGGYLCFEGGEKIAHVLWPAHSHTDHKTKTTGDPAHLEEERAKGAIKTDFILSAEIMTIALAAIPDSNIVTEALTLALVGIGITVAVYGAVALIVKMDDVGLFLAREGKLGVTRGLGRGLVKGMPTFMRWLTIIGTGAMLWVGGSIIVHGLKEMGVKGIYDTIHNIAVAVAHAMPDALQGFMEWFATAAMDGVLGLAIGFALIPIVTKVIAPIWGALSGSKSE